MRRFLFLAVFFVVFFLICFGKSIPIKQNANSINAPIAIDDFYYVREPTGNGTVRRVEPPPGVKGNDITDEPTFWQIATGGGPSHASGLFPDFSAGGFQYISQGGYIGSDSFTYELINTSFPSLSDTAVVTLDILSPDGAEDAGGNYCKVGMVGKPINVTNGNMWIEQSDYSLPGIGENIEISRFYNSIIQKNGHFGFGWSTKYDESLVEYPQNAQGRQMLRVNMPDGRAVYFGRNNTNESYKAPLMGFFGEVIKNVDSNNNTTYTLTFKDGRVHQFYSNGKLHWQKDRNNNQTILAYSGTNGTGNLIGVTDAFNRTLTITPYDSTSPHSGFVHYISDSLGNIATYDYDPDNPSRLKTVTYNDGSKYQFDYTNVVLSNGQTKTVLTTVKDAVNNILEKHEYDDKARAITSEKSPVAGNPQPVEKYTLDYSNWTSSTPHTVVTDANGKVTKYFFDKSKGRNLITKTEGVCSCGGSGSETTNYEYDFALNLTKKTDALGRISEMTYDTSGNLLTQTDKVGTTNLGTHNFTYNSFGQVLTWTDKMSGVWTNTYDASGNLLTTKDALNNVTTITYPTTNNKGLPDKVKDARLNETKLKWFSTGLLEEIEDANLKKTNFTYDARGRTKTVTNALTHVTTYNYFDDTQRKVEMIYPNADKITYKYDIRRLLESITDERGKLTNYTFDNAYRLTRITDALTHAREVGYDLMSNVLWSKDGLGNQTDYIYDDFNRLKEMTYPAANIGDTRLKEKFEYDAVGRIKKIIDTANRETVYNYDDAQRAISVINAELETTQTKFNARMQAIEVKDALNQIYTFTYNPFGQILTQTRAGGTMSYEYDETLNRKKRIDYIGRETTYEYDALNRLKKINYLSTGNPVPLQTAVYNYDDISRLTSAVNEAGAVSFGYDNRNRITSTTDVFGHLINHEYERTSTVNQERLKFDGANYANYNFDDANRLTNIVNQADSTTISFGYDNADRLTSRTYPNGVSTTYGYDNMSRLKRITDTGAIGTLFDRQYGYNNASQINQITEPTLTKTIGYDNVNRLTSVTASNSQNESYNFDDVGNRLSSHKSASYGYQPFNKIISTSSAVYNYDANGNMIFKAEGMNLWRYGFDYENRLVSASTRKQTVRYRYDALGRRVHRFIVGGKENTKFIHDGQDVLVDDNSGTLTKYINGSGIDNKLRQTTGANTEYFLSDHLGSTNGLTDASGNLTAQTSYDSFGNATNANFPSRYQFTGREYDNFTGLHYYRARFYDGNLGRFISEDPIGFAGGDVNLFGYVGNNPMNFIDPSGLQIDPTQVRNCDAKCQADINKMNGVFNQNVSDMTAENRRMPANSTFAGEINNFNASINGLVNAGWQGLFGNRPLPNIQGCDGQANDVAFNLEHQNYNNIWTFSISENYFNYEDVNPNNFFFTTHKWVKVRPTFNPDLPTLRYDPWRNDSSVFK